MRASHFSNTTDGNRDSLLRAWAAFREAPDSLALARLVVASAQPNVARMRARAATNFSTVTDLADLLVRAGGLSFREAHHVVGDVVRDALEQEMAADAITAELVTEAAERVLGRRIEIEPDEVRKSLDPSEVVNARRTPGGTAPAETRRLATEARTRLDADVALLDGRDARIEEARAELERRIGALAGAVA